MLWKTELSNRDLKASKTISLSWLLLHRWSPIGITDTSVSNHFPRFSGTLLFNAALRARRFYLLMTEHTGGISTVLNMKNWRCTSFSNVINYVSVMSRKTLSRISLTANFSNDHRSYRKYGHNYWNVSTEMWRWTILAQPFKRYCSSTGTTWYSCFLLLFQNLL